MATYYVDILSPDDTGNGTTSATSGANAAKKTVQAGLNLCSTNGDTLNIAAGTYTSTPTGSFKHNKAITIVGAGAGTTILNAAGTEQGGFWVSGGTGTLTFQNLTLGQSAGIGFGCLYNDTAMNITMSNCTITNSGDNQCILWLGATGTLTLTNCTTGKGSLYAAYMTKGAIAVSGGSLAGRINMDMAANFGAISITNLTNWSSAGTGHLLRLVGAFTGGAVTITGNTIVNANNDVFSKDTATTIGNFTFSNNDVTSSSTSNVVTVREKVGTVTMQDNDVTLSAVATFGEVFGVGMQPADSPGSIGVVTISGNTISGSTRADGAHGIYIGKGVTSAAVYSNTITGGCAYGVVLKAAAGASVHGNTITATQGILHKNGCANCIIKGNKVTANKTGQVSAGGYDCLALLIGSSPGGTISTGASIQRNWFIGGTSDVSYIFYDYEGINNPADMPTSGYLVDWNFYENNTGTASKLAYLNGAARSSLGAMTTAWAADWDGNPAGALADNDANSRARAAVEDVPAWLTGEVA
jgi:hypothetical protein